MNWSEFQTYLRHIVPADQERINRAFRLGEELHTGQVRKSGEPYFTHPVTVALRLAYLNADADTIIAALLHDAVEDTPATLEDIEKQFDGDVRSLIDGVTKLSAADLADKPNLTEQIETLRKIFRLMQADMRIMVIKLFDRLHNMETIRFLHPERQRELARETNDIYVKIADRLSMQDLRYELENMCLAVLEPDRHGKLTDLREQNRITGQGIIERMRRTLDVRYADIGEHVKMHFELKSWWKLRTQLQAGTNVVTGVSGVTAVFVCDDLDTCYRALGALHGPWRRETMSFQDFINSPMINGYRGLHTTVILEDGTRVRCKIRTKEMQEYARKGVTSLCFDARGRSRLTELLPWLKHIPFLAQDTSDRSRDFWQSLQSDILGESIVVHGTDDRTVLVPKGATALDGAFYLFEKNALRISGLKINGQDVSFDTSLTHAVSLDASFSEPNTVSREWLSSARTAFAAAKIRVALAEASEKERIAIGKSLLQGILHEKRRGFLEEFDESTLRHRLKPAGFRSLREAYLAMADGRLDPEDIFQRIFESDLPAQSGLAARTYAVHSTFSAKDIHKIDAVFLSDTHAPHIRSLRLWPGRDDRPGRVLSIAILTEQEKEMLVKNLRSAGALQVQVDPRATGLWKIIGGLCLTFLWGLDPFIAKWILQHHDVLPLSFTVIRAASVFLFASVLLFLQSQRGRILSRIPLSHASLWIAGIALFLVNVTTYYALLYGTPSLYNTILRGNAALLAIPLLWQAQYQRVPFIALLLTVTGYALIVIRPGYSVGLLLSIAVLAAFNVYTVASNRFQERARVSARYPQFFFFTSAIAAMVALLVFAFNRVPLPPTPVFLGIAAYSIIFIGTPYLIFYWLTQRVGYGNVSPWIGISLVITFLADALSGTTSVLVLVPAAILLLLGNILASHVIRDAR